MSAQRVLAWALLGGLVGCALPREVTKTPRSAIEQLLLTEALHRSARHLTLPLSVQEPLIVEVTGLQSGFPAPSWDLLFIKDSVASRLGVLGYRVVKNESEASFIARVIVQAFGTNQSSSFFGMPPIQSVLIPFSLPQLTLYQNLSQDGYVRYAVDLIERTSGRLFYSTPWYHQQTYHDQYTIFFFITYRLTDLADAP